MFLRILKRSFVRKKERKALAITSVALGVAIVAALLSVAIVIGDRVQRELRAYGANLEVVPKSDTLPIEINGVDFGAVAQGAYLDERELPLLKTIFWRHNIVGFAPYLSTVSTLDSSGLMIPLTGTWFDKLLPVDDDPSFRTGVKTINPYWQVEGRWARDESPEAEAMLGASLARTLSLSVEDSFVVHVNRRAQRFRVVGIVRTGGPEENQAFVRLDLVQRLTNLPNRVKKIQVSALTTPENALAKKDPETMTSEEYETWYCTPYISAIALQIEEVISNAIARPILQVAESEGVILSKLTLLFVLIATAASVASILGVASAMTAIVLERRTEIGLLKAIGAGKAQVLALFLSEAGLVGFVGGLVGFFLGWSLAQIMGRSSFDVSVPLNPAVVLITVLLAVALALFGSLLPVRRAVRVDPVAVLHGQA